MLGVLQLLGCVPTSPGPTDQLEQGASSENPAASADQLDGDHDGIHKQALLEQIANLQAQVGQLEGKQRIKREPEQDGSQTRPAKRVKPEIIVLDD